MGANEPLLFPEDKKKKEAEKEQIELTPQDYVAWRDQQIIKSGEELKETIKTFRGILQGILSMDVVVKDTATGQFLKNEDGSFKTINIKELIMVKTIKNIINFPNIKQVEAMCRITGELNEESENNMGIILKDLRDELLDRKKDDN